MPFPNPLVLTAFLREYIKYRETTTWNTTAGYLKSQVRDDATTKKFLCEETNRKFHMQKKLSTTEGWIDLIYSLGKEGRNPGSLYSDTLQAIRSYIVAVILELPENTNDPSYQLCNTIKSEFLTRRESLAKDTKKLDQEIEQAILAKEPKLDVDRKSHLYHNNLLKLADLGDLNATIKAKRLGLFKELTSPNLRDRTQPLYNELNENIPLCYHNKYYLIFYMGIIQPRMQVSFADFVNSSITNNKMDIEENDKPKAETTSVFGNLASGMSSFMQRFIPAGTDFSENLDDQFDEEQQGSHQVQPSPSTKSSSSSTVTISKTIQLTDNSQHSNRLSHSSTDIATLTSTTPISPVPADQKNNTALNSPVDNGVGTKLSGSNSGARTDLQQSTDKTRSSSCGNP